ncbi:PDZK1-interacting protein 1 [Sphaeramia orbicularis]|uniref:PDZK1-interacting protein 1 n=1 Tax=Sphaeramia orbicularis TaxID=375764 RepID=UPI001180FAA5|nr:PDZK1-interacting protein 1 [Sphaeramia orbicularis]
MVKLLSVVSCLLMTAEAAAAQSGPSAGGQRLLPQWLTGLIAVAVFLFLAFVTFLVKRAWCDESSRRSPVETETPNEPVSNNGNVYDTRLSTVRSSEDANAYENLVIDSSDDKVTAM